MIEFEDVAGWRDWLARHGTTAAEVWLVVHRDGGGPSHAEAVEQALCFGWIDSLARRRDAGSFLQRFSPRRAGSRWSEGRRLDADPQARSHFDGFPPSSHRLILTWIAAAKRPQTRQQRIERTVALAALGIRAAHPAVQGRTS